jgi:hypothetical protein
MDIESKLQVLFAELSGADHTRPGSGVARNHQWRAWKPLR